jgi:hypothetical protein
MQKAEEFDRVRRHTSRDQLAKVDINIRASIEYYATRSKDEISQRIRELELEWDVERFLETNASIAALTGVVLGVTHSRKWLLLSGTVLTFLFQHAVQGWCPPVPILRRMGVRTQSEIDREKYALKYLRGDFDAVAKGQSPVEEACVLAQMVTNGPSVNGRVSGV